MSVDRDEVERIAELARLRLDDEEVARLTADMNAILDHATRLREVQGSDASAPETGRDRAPTATRREGEDVPDALHRPIREWAPETAEGFFLVPPPPGVTAEDDS